MITKPKLEAIAPSNDQDKREVLENDPAKPEEPKSDLTKPEVPDPFDLASLRLNPSFLETAGVKKLLTTVPVRKPNPQDFVRVHPAPEYRENFLMIDLRDDRREDYLCRPELAADLTGETVMKTIFSLRSTGRASRSYGRCDCPRRMTASKTEWPRSEREAAEMAMTRWVRLKANMSLGAYEITVAESVMADPVWPELPFQQLVRLGFRDRMISSVDHPVVRRLRGLP